MKNIKTILLALFQYSTALCFIFASSVFACDGNSVCDPEIINENTVEDPDTLPKSSPKDHRFSFKDLYKNTYKGLAEIQIEKSHTVKDKTYFAVATSLGVKKSDLELMLLDEDMLDGSDKSEEALLTIAKKKDAIDKIGAFCKNSNGLNMLFVECQQKIKERIKNEYERQMFQEDMHSYALEEQSLINGTLQDTNGEFFDIIVDLNIIDLILFGDKMNRPLTGSPFLRYNPFAPDENNPNSDSGSSTSSPNNTPNPNNQELANNQNSNTGNNTNSNISNTSNNTSINGNEEYIFRDQNSTILGYTEQSGEGFCIDPDGMIFKNSIIHTVEGDTTGDTDVSYLNPYSMSNFDTAENGEGNTENEGSVQSSYASVLNTVYPNDFEDIQMGNIMPPQIKYTGGVYPDLTKISHKTQCNDDEKAFLNGRICIKKFCEDLLCIRINMKYGTWNSDTPLRKMNCVECNIDRGNEAILPFIRTYGQSTPNQNSMESNFLSAFGNLKKSIPHNVYLKPKRLPFLIYDEAHPNDKEKYDKEKEEKSAEEKKKKTEKSTEETTEEEKKKAKEEKISANREIYNSLLISHCSEEVMNIEKGAGLSEGIANYCTNISQEQKEEATLKTKKLKNSLHSEFKYTTQNELRSDNFQKMLRPLLQQFTADIVIMNKYLQTIDPSTIRKTGKECR